MDFSVVVVHADHRLVGARVAKGGYLNVNVEDGVCSGEEGEKENDALMNHLPDIIAELVIFYVAEAVLNDEINDADEEDIRGVVEHRFQRWQSEVGFGHFGAKLMDDAITSRPDETSVDANILVFGWTFFKIARG